MLKIGTLTEPSGVEFFYRPFDKVELQESHAIIVPTFEEQADLIVDNLFPEVKAFRERTDNLNKRSDEDFVSVFSIMRDKSLIPICVLYVGQKMKRLRKARRPTFGSVGFYRMLLMRTVYAVKRLRAMKYQDITVVLPGRFYPSNMTKGAYRGEREEEIFVRSMTAAIVEANGTLEIYTSKPDPRLKTACFTHFGQSQSRKAVPHFFARAVGAGINMGEAVVEARRFTLLPPSDKTPLSLAQHFLGKEIDVSKRATKKVWCGIRGHRFGSEVKASIIHGVENLQKAGFNMIAAIGRGSIHEPCFLKLHYRPSKEVENMKKISLLGKGVVFDTGGTNLKDTDSMVRMHYDMAGAATVVANVMLAVKLKLRVEIVALIPLVDNAISSKSIRPGEIVRCYDGQTNEITNTDSEGRVILADAIAFSEKHLQPDCTVTVATLSDMSPFGPDLLKVMVNCDDLEKKAQIARLRSHEKYIQFPRPEDLDDITTLHMGDLSDLINESDFHYHSDPFMTMYDYFVWEDTKWMHLDVAVVFESDADEYGAGPGFGVRFLAEFVKQFAPRHS